MYSIASPWVTPMKGTPEIVAAFCCWKRLSACGIVFVVMCTTVESGIDSPLAVRI